MLTHRIYEADYPKQSSMRKLIAIAKSASFIFITIGAYLIYLIFLPFVYMTSQRYESWRNLSMKGWGRASLKVLGVDLQIHGSPPDPPFFVVSNHISYLDIPVLSAILHGTYIAKYEIREWPVIGWMAHMLGIVFINRKRKRDVARVNNIISSKIDQTQGIILFPEGKTSSGEQLLPYRPSLLEHAANEGIHVHCAVIRYETDDSDPSATESVAWATDISMAKHLLMLASNRKIHAQITFNSKPLKAPDRKMLAGMLYRESEKIFTPMSKSVTA